MQIDQIILEYRKHTPVNADRSLSVHYQDLYHCSTFLTEKKTHNIESTLLELGGHRPETKFVYSKKEFVKWCETNNIIYEFNDLKQEVLLIL